MNNIFHFIFFCLRFHNITTLVSVISSEEGGGYVSGIFSVTAVVVIGDVLVLGIMLIFVSCKLFIVHAPFAKIFVIVDSVLKRITHRFYTKNLF